MTKPLDPNPQLELTMEFSPPDPSKSASNESLPIDERPDQAAPVKIIAIDALRKRAANAETDALYEAILDSVNHLRQG